MGGKLNLQKSKHKVENDSYGGFNYVTRYSNDAYTVYIIEEEDFARANVVRQSFEYPEIYIGSHGGINIPALGTLKPNDLDEYVKKMIVAKETYIQTIDLINNYFK